MDGSRSVYDLTNCGPRNRFVVQDENGQPLIVHNCENAIQATARQILWPAARAVEEAGYHVILTVYDEIVAEVPEGFGSLKEFEQIALSAVPDFAKHWPIRVDGWEGNRYKK